MKNNICHILFLLIFSAVCSTSLKAQNPKDLTIIRETNKVALVIGNSNYQNGFNKLSSPQNDAAAMAAALKRLGFRLIGGRAQINTTFSEMENLLDQFTGELKNGGVGFFYFSGHGAQNLKRENFLIPVDTKISFQSDLAYKAMQVEQITSRMEETGNILNILVLDACRDNPLPSGTKSGSKGLNTDHEIPSGIYIAFAARDGQTALDGEKDGYSLYTQELLKNIEDPNERLEDIFIRTRVAVKNETKNRQFPFDYGSIDGRFYFKIEGQTPNAGNSSTNTTNNSNWITEGNKYFEIGLKCGKIDYDCQISNYSKAINLNPNDGITYYKRGNAYRFLRNYDAAIRDYTKAIELNPRYSEAYNNRGSAYDDQHNYDAAIRDYTKAIELNPRDFAAYNNRGSAYDDQHNYDAAIRDHTKAIELNPQNADVYYNRAISYKGKLDYTSAIRDYTKAIELNPQYSEAYNNRGSTYDDQHNYDAAIRDYTKAIELNPRYSEAYNNRGIAYRAQQNHDAAIRDYTKAIELNPQYSTAYFNRAISYTIKLDYTAAIQDYTKVIELTPQNADAYDNRANIYEVINEKAKAQADRNKAGELKKLH